MVNLKCIAIDDEPLALDIIRYYAGRVPGLNLLQTFTNANAAIEFLNTHPVNLVFLDINMPHISGLELARQLEHRPMIIFTTAHKQFAYEGFELEAIDYLLKPIEFQRFQRAVEKAVDYAGYRSRPPGTTGESLFVYSEYRLIKVELDAIEYIESLENYIKIYEPGQKPVLTLMTMKKVQEKLPAEAFMRVHRSYIVPKSRVKQVLKGKLLLDTGREIPIGESYADAVREWVAA